MGSGTYWIMMKSRKKLYIEIKKKRKKFIEKLVQQKYIK